MPLQRTALVLVLFASVWGGACASTGATPRPFPSPEPRSPADASSASPVPSTAATRVASGYAIAGTALELRGSPYRNGGSDPKGFDCSGLVWYVFAQHGVQMPRTVGEQFRVGRQVPVDQVAAGDLVFFDITGGGVSHVGMVIGGDEFVHAPSSSGRVRVERLTSGYWAPRFVGARRIAQ